MPARTAAAKRRRQSLRSPAPPPQHSPTPSPSPSPSVSSGGEDEESEAGSSVRREVVRFRKLIYLDPLGDRLAVELPGIGEKTARTLKARADITMASEILGQFLLFKKHKALFYEWMCEKGGCSRHQAKQCCDYIRHWCDSCM